MEFNATLVGVIILLLIFVPIILMVWNASGKEKKAKKSLIQISKNKSLELKEIEVIGNVIIGLDEKSKKLVYSFIKNLKNDIKIIDVNELKNCRVKTVHQTGNSLEWVGLELIGSNNRYEIPFYDDTEEEGGAKDPLMFLQDAKRWENHLRPMLKAS